MSPRQKTETKMEDMTELSKAGYAHADGAPKPPPMADPTFTVADLKAAIPPHCFEKDTLRGLSVLFWNLLTCVVLFYGAYTVLELMQLPLPVKILGYMVYWYVQGSYGMGLWVIAHECGHYGMSDSNLMNDIVGAFCHSILMTPYHSWQITHKIHHANTGSCENDEVYAPFSRSDLAPTWNDLIEDSPTYNLYRIVKMLLIGWLPGYLVVNSWGPAKYRTAAANHFNPDSAFYLPKERNVVILSNIECLAVLAVTGYFIHNYGFWLVFNLYLAPLLVTNAYLVVITYLNHTDTFVPHLREDGWNWLHGNLCTVDRSFGKWLDGVLHRVTDTHVLHHLFPKIPHYHAAEAFEAIKPILGDYHLRDETPIFVGKILIRLQNGRLFFQ